MILVNLVPKVNVLKTKLWIFAKVYLTKVFLIGISQKFILAEFSMLDH